MDGVEWNGMAEWSGMDGVEYEWDGGVEWDCGVQKGWEKRRKRRKTSEVDLMKYGI